ncbi:nucleotidyltransferase [Methanocella sp. CWC-04]|uniref:Nucleotidyltransferase n=1 Tax=Methanooceanicella nereidis TaxID=2052831 RepID=A0AAP2RDT4_9EURY|nr:nucleotidyltransferase [Methanocella sp. CWC-04]
MYGDKRYLLGRRDGGSDGLLFLGRYLALDGSSGSPVFLDVLKPHAILICGKRGYGKSYTMGTIIEEFARLPAGIRNNFSVIVVDTMGIFTCMGSPNLAEKKYLESEGLSPEGLNIKIFAPGIHTGRYDDVDALTFKIPSSSLSPYDYCELLGVDPLSPHGAVLAGAICSRNKFSIEDLIAEINSSDATDDVRSSLNGLLTMISAWDIFSADADYSQIMEPGSVNIIDLSGYGHEPGIKSCIVASLSRALYDIRVEARRKENTGYRRTPLVWMFIDEAHMFMDTGAGNVLINEWLRQGRQPGLSLVLATQRPSALGRDVLSQADMIICHRLTLRDDIEALEKARPSYVKEPVNEALSRLGAIRGAAVIVDDTTESYHVVKVRPRVSLHGGGEPIVRNVD